MMTKELTIAWDRAYKVRTLQHPEVSHPGGGEDDGVELPGTFLAIPYFPGDKGLLGTDRPLGNKAISYLCPSIVVNGIKGWNVFQHDVPTTVTVDVVNSGHGTTVAPVQVAVWWVDPSTAFTWPNLRPFGQTSMAVPTDGVPRTSPPITGVIEAALAPSHICLLARVSSVFGGPDHKGPILPADDQHWAQLNLNALASNISQPFQFLFWAGNPFDRSRNFDVVARPVDAEALPVLGRYLHMDLTPIRGMDLQLADPRGAWSERQERGGRVAIVLQPQERRPMTITGMLPDEVEPGRSVALEVVQTVVSESGSTQLVGSIGLIVTGQQRG